MGIKECILVVKKTVINQSNRASRMARAGDLTASRLVAADREHNRTLDAVREKLARLGVSFREMGAHTYRSSEKRKLSTADLVVTVGGDGTILSASHYVRQGTLIGVNSAPGDSIGHFCSTSRRGFERVVEDYLSGARRPLELARLEVRLDGEKLPELVLNDVLVAHESPAATTRYILQVGDITEEHRSSGIWVSTAAGSTAAIKSAGGKKLPTRSRRFQYLVRELYREEGRDYRLVRGVLRPDQEIVVAAKMPEGRVYIDGSRTMYRLLYGMRVAMRVADEPLKILPRESTK